MHLSSVASLLNYLPTVLINPQFCQENDEGRLGGVFDNGYDDSGSVTCWKTGTMIIVATRKKS